MGLRTQKRRRRENKTDYRARRIMLTSGLPRIVIRRTNKYFILQAIESHEAQDKVIATVTSKELLSLRDDSDKYNNDWDEKKAGSLKGISAGYLTGILMAKKLKGKGEFIVDLGMARTHKGNRVFAVVAGLVEGGLDVSHDKKVFPDEDRLMGEHCGIRDMVEKVRGGLA